MVHLILFGSPVPTEPPDESGTGFPGPASRLSTVLSWPLQQPVGCFHGVNALAPYKTTVYKNIIANHLTTLPTITATPNPIIVDETGFGTATISWNAPGTSWVEVMLSIDGGLSGGYAGGGMKGSGSAPWIQIGYSYTFQLYPALPPDGHPDMAHLLNSVTVTGRR